MHSADRSCAHANYIVVTDTNWNRFVCTPTIDVIESSVRRNKLNDAIVSQTGDFRYLNLTRRLISDI